MDGAILSSAPALHTQVLQDAMVDHKGQEIVYGQVVVGGHMVKYVFSCSRHPGAQGDTG